MFEQARKPNAPVSTKKGKTTAIRDPQLQANKSIQTNIQRRETSTKTTQTSGHLYVCPSLTASPTDGAKTTPEEGFEAMNC